MPKSHQDIIREDPDLRFSLLLGGLLALLIIAGFIYPSGAYPIQNLVICAVLLTGGFGLVMKNMMEKTKARAVMLTALGSAPILSGLGLVLWAVLRWKLMSVHAPGRDWLISLLWMAVAMVMGSSLAVFSLGQLKSVVPLLLLRRLLLIGAIGFSLMALYQYFIGYNAMLQLLRAENSGPVTDLKTQSLLHALSERRVAGQLGNPNLFAAQMVIFALFCLSSFGQGERQTWRWIGGIGFLLSVWTILLTGSRGGLLTMTLMTGLVLLAIGGSWRGNRFKRGPGKMLASLLGLILLFLSAQQAWAGGDSLVERFCNISTIRERLFYWLVAAKVWARHPWIGEGPGGFSLLYLTLKSPLARESQYAHSWFFQVGAELGLVGLILILGFWFGSFWNSRTILGRRDSQDDADRSRNIQREAVWIVLALLVLAFNGLFEFSLQWRPFLILAGLLAGLASGLVATEDIDASRTRSIPSHTKAIRGYVGVGMSLGIAVIALLMTPADHLASYCRWQGDMLAEEGRWNEAAAALGQAVRYEPDDSSYYLAQAAMLTSAGDRAQAGTLLTQAAQLNPYSAATREAQAEWLYAQGRSDGAMIQMDEAIKCYPTHVGHRLRRAEMQLHANRPAQAREDLIYIEKNQLPIWEYQQTPYNQLRRAVGLTPISFSP